MRHLNKNAMIDSIRKSFMADAQNGNIHAAAVQVTQLGHFTYRECLGTVSPDKIDPLPENTLFRMASMTKPVTAVAIGILVDRKLIVLDDLVEHYLPRYRDLKVADVNENGQFVNLRPVSVKPTIRHLLTHTSGIGTGAQGDISTSKMKDEDCRTLAAAVDYFAGEPLAFDPMSSQYYSPWVAFDMLARIIETVSGMPYPAFVKHFIFDPCKMTDATFDPTEDQWDRTAVMHDKADGKAIAGFAKRGCAFETIPCSHPLGGAGLMATINDYANFAEMLLTDGTFRWEKVVSEEYLREMSRAQVPDKIMPTAEKWGLGCRVITDTMPSGLVKGAFGWSGAYGTHFFIDPANKIFAVFLKNSRYDGGSGARTAAVFEKNIYDNLI